MPCPRLCPRTTGYGPTRTGPETNLVISEHGVIYLVYMLDVHKDGIYSALLPFYFYLFNVL